MLLKSRHVVLRPGRGASEDGLFGRPVLPVFRRPYRDAVAGAKEIVRPVLARQHRVVDRDGGWESLGRERLAGSQQRREEQVSHAIG